MTTDRALARRRLDDRFLQLRPLEAAAQRPHRGWIRAIRDALGMSTSELAKRMGVIQQNVSALERAEQHGTIKLETLRRAADALDCDVVYVLLPRTGLDQAARAQARRRASALLGPVAHHGRLEDQSISATETSVQLDALAERFLDRRGLWSDADRPA